MEIKLRGQPAASHVDQLGFILAYLISLLLREANEVYKEYKSTGDAVGLPMVLQHSPAICLYEKI